MGKSALDLKFSFRADKIYLTDEKGELTESEITSVGGVSSDKIIAAVNETFPTDTPFMEKDIRKKYVFDKEILALCGCDTTQPEIEVVCSDQTITAVFVDSDEAVDDSEAKTASAKMIDDIFYVDVNSFFTKDEDYVAVLQQARDFTQNGGGKVIIDVRDNIGGNYDRVSELMSSFDISIPEGRAIIRHTNGEWQSIKKDPASAVADKTFSDYPASTNMVKANPNIDLAVLCNENTCDAAVALCTGVKDGEVGTVLGKATHSSPAFYYGAVDYELPNSKITVKISSSYRFRPNTDNHQEVFIPNEIIFDDDPLQYTIDNHFKAAKKAAEEEVSEEPEETEETEEVKETEEVSEEVSEETQKTE